MASGPVPLASITLSLSLVRGTSLAPCQGFSQGTKDINGLNIFWASAHLRHQNPPMRGRVVGPFRAVALDTPASQHGDPFPLGKIVDRQICRGVRHQGKEMMVILSHLNPCSSDFQAIQGWFTISVIPHPLSLTLTADT